MKLQVVAKPITGFLALLLCLLSNSAPASADPVMECSLHTTSQVETAECLARIEADVDATIDRAFEFAHNAAEELDEVTGRRNAQPALVDAQTAWSGYRDAHCSHVGSMFGGGTGTGIAIRSCRIDLGRDRVRQLLALLN